MDRISNENSMPELEMGYQCGQWHSVAWQYMRKLQSTGPWVTSPNGSHMRWSKRWAYVKAFQRTVKLFPTDTHVHRPARRWSFIRRKTSCASLSECQERPSIVWNEQIGVMGLTLLQFGPDITLRWGQPSAVLAVIGHEQSGDVQSVGMNRERLGTGRL